jgi:hypothetical protein
VVVLKLGMWREREREGEVVKYCQVNVNINKPRHYFLEARRVKSHTIANPTNSKKSDSIH